MKLSTDHRPTSQLWWQKSSKDRYGWMNTHSGSWRWRWHCQLSSRHSGSWWCQVWFEGSAGRMTGNKQSCWEDSEAHCKRSKPDLLHHTPTRDEALSCRVWSRKVERFGRHRQDNTSKHHHHDASYFVKGSERGKLKPIQTSRNWGDLLAQVTFFKRSGKENLHWYLPTVWPKNSFFPFRWSGQDLVFPGQQGWGGGERQTEREGERESKTTSR